MRQVTEEKNQSLIAYAQGIYRHESLRRIRDSKLYVSSCTKERGEERKVIHRKMEE